jgi:drug/metabolite transporter (DMT)-like permease
MPNMLFLLGCALAFISALAMGTYCGYQVGQARALDHFMEVAAYKCAGPMIAISMVASVAIPFFEPNRLAWFFIMTVWISCLLAVNVVLFGKMFLDTFQAIQSLWSESQS